MLDYVNGIGYIHSQCEENRILFIAPALQQGGHRCAPLLLSWHHRLRSVDMASEDAERLAEQRVWLHCLIWFGVFY